MKFFSPAAFVASVAVASAAAAPKGHHWKAPGPGDVRSPCPGLNSLANHGFLPRDGKDITVGILNKAGKEGLNMGHDFMTSIGLLGLQSAGPLATSFNLDQLDHHDFPIEHDASLSRQDTYFGENHDLVPRSYKMFMEPYKGKTNTDLSSASSARYIRVNDSMVNNPEVGYGPRELVLSYGETSLYLQTMGRSTTSGVAPLSYVRSLFKHERLPYHLGWTPSPDPITLLTLGEMMVQLQRANPDVTDETIYVLTNGTLADFLEGRLILNSTLPN